MDISAYYDVPGVRIAAARDSLYNIRSEGGDIEQSYQDEMMQTQVKFMPPQTASISIQNQNFNETRTTQLYCENSIQESIRGEDNNGSEMMRKSGMKNMTNASRCTGSQRVYKVQPLRQYNNSNQPTSYKMNIARQRNKL